MFVQMLDLYAEFFAFKSQSLHFKCLNALKYVRYSPFTQSELHFYSIRIKITSIIVMRALF